MVRRLFLVAALVLGGAFGATDFSHAQTPLAQGFKDLKDGPGKVVETPDRGSVLEITNADVTTATLRSLPLPMENLPGASIAVRCDVSAENISPKPELWNGVKVMVHSTSSSGDTWDQATLPVGTFDVQHVFAHFRIPANATSVTLLLGLEKVTGTAHISNLSVTLGTKFVAAPAAPPDQPVFTGHDVPRLRGAMVDPKMTEADLANFAHNWNGNLIRWQLFRVEPKTPEHDFAPYDAWLDGMLAKTDLVLGWAAQHHVKVVLDLHTPPGGKGYATGSLFVNAAAQKHFLEVWRRLAQRYKGNATIWGYDLVNEPNDDEVAPDCKDWQDLSLDAARVVREIEPDRTLIVEPAKYGGAPGLKYFNPLPLPHIVYSFHMYEPLRFTHQRVFNPNDGPYAYPGAIDGKTWDRDALLRAMEPAIDFAHRYRAQIYVGEFSAIRWAPGADKYLADVTSIFEEQGWDWSYHAYREWHGWSLEHGPDKDDLKPVAQPTARFEVIEKLLKENQKPAN